MVPEAVNRMITFIDTIRRDDVKEAIGYINPQRMASSIIKNEFDEDDYFMKRIIVIELFIKQIRKEYGCSN